MPRDPAGLTPMALALSRAELGRLCEMRPRPVSAAVVSCTSSLVWFQTRRTQTCLFAPAFTCC